MTSANTTCIVSRKALFAAALLVSPLTAQGQHLFVVDQAQSSFSFSGSVTYQGVSGPLVGNPSTFNVSGEADAVLTAAAGALTTGQLVDGGSEVVVPTLSASVPNPFPFLPPLATITVSGARVAFASVDPATLAPASFAIGAGGAFSTSMVATMLAGTANINALGSVQTVSLGGQQSAPQPVNGTFVPTPGGIRLSVPVATTFSFADPATGSSGSLTLNGTLVADDVPFSSDTDSISLATGGTQGLRLSAGTTHGGAVYVVAGSISGTSPGFTVGAVTVPLNPDGYTSQTVSAPNTPPLTASFGNLDAIGLASAAFSLPPLAIPALVGLNIDHAYVVLSGSMAVFASNPVRVTLAQ